MESRAGIWKHGAPCSTVVVALLVKRLTSAVLLDAGEPERN